MISKQIFLGKIDDVEEPSAGLTEEEIASEVAGYLEEEAMIDEGIEKHCSSDSSGRRIRRLPCLAHLLQLIMAVFDIFRTTKDQQPLFSKAIKKARKLVTSFNSSATATTKLIDLCGKKLIGDVVTKNKITALSLLSFMYIVFLSIIRFYVFFGFGTICCNFDSENIVYVLNVFQ